MRIPVALAVKGTVSAFLLKYALDRVNFDVVGERLDRLDVSWMLMAVVMVFVQFVLISTRWRQIARQCDASLGRLQALRFTLIAAFFNQVLPSTVGGDAVRVWLLARDGPGWSKATYSVLLDRFIGTLALALLVVACLPWALESIRDPIGRIALLAIGLGIIGAALVFLIIGHLHWAGLQRWAPTRHLAQLAMTVRQMLNSVGTVGLVVALSLSSHVLSAAAAWCAARAIAAPLEFAYALLLVPPVLLVASIPVSIAGWGVRESALMLAFGYAGLSEGDGLIVSVLLGVAMLVGGIIGGIVWLGSSDRIPFRQRG